MKSKNNIEIIGSSIESLGGNTKVEADKEINIKAGENYQEFAYSSTSSSSSWGGLKKKTTTENHHEQHLTHTGSVIKGRDGVSISGKDSINIEGSKIGSRAGDIKLSSEGDVNIKAVQDKHLVEHSSNTTKSFVGINYGKSNSSSVLNQTINQGSISDAMGNIDSKAGGITTLEGSKLKSGGIVTINSAKGIQILSTQNTSDYQAQSSSSSFGSLLSNEQKESLQKALTVSSLIEAKEVNLQTQGGVIIKGSQIQANTVNFMASFLTLLSDKNSETYSSFSDGSGVLVRKIINQGYVKETAVEAKVDAQKITLNGKALLEDKLKPDSLLKQLSSEHNLNEAQINQIKAELTNKEWNDKKTTVSQMGMIIIQAIVTVLTAGTGTGLVAAVETGINATVDTMVNAAINSMINQTLTQMATSAVTGNKLNLDLDSMLENSLKAAAFAGLTAQIDANLGLNKEKLNYAEKSTQQILHGFVRKAVYGGDIETILANSAANVAFDYVGHSVYSNDSQFPQLRDAIPKTVIHSLIGGTLSELAGGDFSQGAIATATSHTVAEYIDKELFEKTVKGDISKEQAKAYVKAMSSVVSGAVVLATHEKVTDKELKIAQDLGESVVVNNALKGFDAKVEFAKGIYQGSSEKVWEDLKALGLALNSPIETVKALMNLVATPEALAVLGEDIVNDLKLKSINVYSALISDTVYEGEKANQAGRDLGELALTVLEAYSGVKGVTTGANAAKNVIKAVETKVDKVISDTVDFNMKFITLNGNSVELASVGSKGNWDKLINKDLKPNMAYVLDNGHTYITNASGKVNYVEADLSKITMPRNNYQQSVVGNSGLANDQGGHLIASALGGAGDRINLVPMDSVLNNGAYKKMEADLLKAVSEGKSVSVKIDVGYPASGGTRPSSFTVNYTIDGGKPIKKEFRQ